MAVTLTEISGWLDNIGIKHKLEEEKIFFGAGDDENTQGYFIRTPENGEMFDAQMQILNENRDFVSLEGQQHAAKVLEHILYLNYTTKFGTWEYDPRDGDIRLAVEIPLEDATMTEKQFNRICGLLIKQGTDAAKDIKEILKNGEIPSKDEEQDVVAMLEALLAEAKAKAGEPATAEDGI